MTALDELQHEARRSYEWLESIVSDVSAEQASWPPPGRANTIAQTYAHIVRNADEDLNQHLFARAMLKEGPWLGRNGLEPGRSDWDPAMRIDWQALREYGRTVHAFVIETVDALTAADLHRYVEMGIESLGKWEGIDVVRLTVGRHVWMHGGEIACLKGLQGAKGYRAGLDADGP